MAKPADLRQAMSASAKSAQSIVKPEETNIRKLDQPENPHYRPVRSGKSNVTGYFPGDVKKQLRLLAAEKETTIQRLLAEALNDLFAKYGKPEIASLDEKSA